MSTMTLPIDRPETRRVGGGDQASRLRAMVMAMRDDRQVTPPSVSAPRSCPLVAIASGKGGVGKTTLAVNIAISLAQAGARATLLDADLGMANADVLCGLMPVRRLEQAAPSAHSSTTLASIAITAPGGFRLIPGSVGVARIADLTDEDRVGILDQLAEVERSSDLVLVDTGAGISPGVLGFLDAADCVIVVATPEPTSIADAYALIKCLSQMRSSASHRRGWEDAPPISLAINQAADLDEARGVHARIDAVAQKFLGFSVPLLGWVHDDSHASAAVRARTPLLIRSPRSRSAEDVRSLSNSLARSLRLDMPVDAAPTRRWGRWFLRGS